MGVTLVAGQLGFAAVANASDIVSVETIDGVSFGTQSGTATLSGMVSITDDGSPAPLSIGPESYVPEVGFYVTRSDIAVTECTAGVKVIGATADPTLFTSEGSVGQVGISAALDGLSSNSDYYYCAYALSPEEGSLEVTGVIYKFTTPIYPLPSHSLDLNMTLGANGKFAGSTAVASGSGLKEYSTASLYQYSTPKLITTFAVDQYGKFSGTFVIPGCGTVGKHKLRIEGLAPDGSALSDEVYFVVDPNCKVQATSGAPLQRAAISIPNVLFANNSALLTTKSKKVLRAWAPLLLGAGTVTINGYTETKQTSKAARLACLKLSKQRALAVQKYLRSQGVKVNFIAIGNGATSPASKKQALNRRATTTFPMTYGDQ